MSIKETLNNAAVVNPKPNEPVVHLDKAIEILENDRKYEERSNELLNRLNTGRDYLMTTSNEDLLVEDALEAFGFGRNGLNFD